MIFKSRSLRKIGTMANTTDNISMTMEIDEQVTPHENYSLNI